MALILIMVLVLYTDDLLVTSDEPMMEQIRGRWLLNPEMMYHGMMNQFMEFGKEIPYCKDIGKCF